MAWEVECWPGLKAAGAVLKDLPKKPKRVLKASLMEREESDEEGGESGPMMMDDYAAALIRDLSHLW